MEKRPLLMSLVTPVFSFHDNSKMSAVKKAYVTKLSKREYGYTKKPAERMRLFYV